MIPVLFAITIITFYSYTPKERKLGNLIYNTHPQERKKIPKKLISDFRLTLDYQEDLDLLNSISDKIDIQNPNYPLEKIISFLGKNKKISMINSLHKAVYKSDKNLISILNTETKIKT